AGEQAEADRAAWRRATTRKQAGAFEHDAGAGAVVGRPLAEVPGVEVSADDDKLVGFLGALDLADDVVHDDRAGDEFVGDIQLDAGLRRLGPAGKTPEHLVV